MNEAVNQLISFALKNQLIDECEADYSANLLIDLLKISEFKRLRTEEASLYDVLDRMLDYAVKVGLIQDTVTERDLFDTRIMNCVMPRPGEVTSRFDSLYKQSAEAATEYYYSLSINSNYIRKSRTDQNILFSHDSDYGKIQISINMSKPEKDPKEIAAAKLQRSVGYPECLLCKENVGYAGHLNHPARQTHRIIPIDLQDQRYYLQYSPYVYYNEHCIVFNEEHIPMQINRRTFENLIAFIRQFPHYMLGSNADLPIVGGSILTHDHYQGGGHFFPMQAAEAIYSCSINNVDVEIIKWPLSTLRLSSDDPQELADLSDTILQKWIGYSDEALDIIAFTGDERHNTVTPIARFKDGRYQMDIVLRNNRTSEQHPLGIFHPHSEHHHIKKENIGLIEVMGLAILPARLKTELELLKGCLLGKADIKDISELDKHREWYEYLKGLGFSEADIDEGIEKEVVKKFVAVLEDAGVFKMNESGIAGFKRFVQSLMED